MYTLANLFKQIPSSLRKTMNSNSGFSIAGVLVSSAIGVVLLTSLMDSQLTTSRIYKKLKISSDKEWTSTVMRTIISEAPGGIEQCLDKLNKQIKLPTNLKFFWTKESYSSSTRHEYFIGVADSTSTETTSSLSTDPSNPGLRWRSALKSDYPQVRVVDLTSDDDNAGVPECSLHQNESEVPCYDVEDKVGSLGYGKTKVGCKDDGMLTSELTAFGFQAGGDGENAGANTFIGIRAGKSNTEGNNNTFIGYEAGLLNTGALKAGSQIDESSTTGSSNVFIGHSAGKSNTEGNNNTFIGYEAGESNETGSSNVFIGHSAGKSNTEGNNNIFIGHEAGLLNTGELKAGSQIDESSTTGSSNVFIGHSAGKSNTEGNSNIFMGSEAGLLNTGELKAGSQTGESNETGSSNVFIGHSAGAENTTGFQNTFMGHSAGKSNTEGFSNIFIGNEAGAGSPEVDENDVVIAGATGDKNTFIGHSAGSKNTTGHSNAFMGFEAGKSNTEGNNNTFIGHQAGLSSTGELKEGSDTEREGINNTFIGFKAGQNSTGNESTFVGHQTGLNSTGAQNTFIGFEAGHRNATGERNVFIGYQAGYNSTIGSDKLIIATHKKKKLITGFFVAPTDKSKGVTIHGDLTVDGNLTGGTHVHPSPSSDRRLKKNIKALDHSLEKLLTLKASTYYWKDKQKGKTKQIGFIAQDVEKVYPNLVVKNKETKMLSLNYIGLIPVIVQSLKEFYHSTAKTLTLLKTELSSLVQKNKKLERDVASFKNQLNSSIQQRDVADNKSRKH